MVGDQGSGVSGLGEGQGSGVEGRAVVRCRESGVSGQKAGDKMVAKSAKELRVYDTT